MPIELEQASNATTFAFDHDALVSLAEVQMPGNFAIADLPDSPPNLGCMGELGSTDQPAQVVLAVSVIGWVSRVGSRWLRRIDFRPPIGIVDVEQVLRTGFVGAWGTGGEGESAKKT